MDVLTFSNVCYSVKPGFIKSSRLLSTVYQSIEPIFIIRGLMCLAKEFATMLITNPSSLVPDS